MVRRFVARVLTALLLIGMTAYSVAVRNCAGQAVVSKRIAEKLWFANEQVAPAKYHLRPSEEATWLGEYYVVVADDRTWCPVTPDMYIRRHEREPFACAWRFER